MFSNQYLISIYQSSLTSYMVKCLGGADNILSCEKNEVTGRWTHYIVEIDDPKLIIPHNKRLMRVTPIYGG